MTTLNIDIETYSEADLKKCGMYKYAAHPSFEIMLFGYSIDGAPAEVIDLTSGAEIPLDIILALHDPAVEKKAFNAQFERVCINQYLNIKSLNWSCTMIKAGMFGLPMNLEGAGMALKTSTMKATVGKQLIRYFCIPCKPTAANGMRARNLPQHAPEKWAQFIDYCQVDVETEMEIDKKLASFVIPETERQLYLLDQKINDYGVMADPLLIEKAIHESQSYTVGLIEEAKQLTGIDNPKSVQQLLRWLVLEIDESVTNLKADAVHKLLQGGQSEKVQRVLKIRQQISKASVRKYAALKEFINTDSRVRGILQFYGANRTGRWAGRGPQIQNLPKNNIRDLALARNTVRDGQHGDLEWLFTDVSDVLSQLIRTAFVAPPGKTLIMSDFSAIEARVIAWYANEKWRLDVFNTHGKIYEASGAAMFKVPIESVTKGSALRDKAKIAELALGFAGGVNALKNMGSEKMGLRDDELPELVGRWRDADKNIVRLWGNVQDAAIECVRTGVAQKLTNALGVTLEFYMKRGMFFIRLPSGRSLAYLRPTLKPGKFGNVELSYWGVNQKTRQWEEIKTYGGKLIENIVQATARDLLAEKMLALDDAGYRIVFHVHDEIVIEVEDYGSADFLAECIDSIMAAPLPWSKGLPLAADSYASPFYKKD